MLTRIACHVKWMGLYFFERTHLSVSDIDQREFIHTLHWQWGLSIVLHSEECKGDVKSHEFGLWNRESHVEKAVLQRRLFSESGHTNLTVRTRPTFDSGLCCLRFYQVNRFSVPFRVSPSLVTCATSRKGRLATCSRGNITRQMLRLARPRKLILLRRPGIEVFILESREQLGL